MKILENLKLRELQNLNAILAFATENNKTLEEVSEELTFFINKKVAASEKYQEAVVHGYEVKSTVEKCPSCGQMSFREVSPQDGINRKGCSTCYYSQLVEGETDGNP